MTSYVAQNLDILKSQCGIIMSTIMMNLYFGLQ